MPFTPSPYFQACVSKSISESVGKPWVCLGRGPDSFDCWGFVIWVFDSAGIKLPDWVYSPDDPRTDLFQAGLLDGWVRVDSNETCSIVTLGRKGAISHVAIKFKGVFYHCTENFGVIAQSNDAILRSFDTLDYWWPNDR